MKDVLVKQSNQIDHLHESNDKTRVQFSSADKIILKALLNSPGRVNVTQLHAMTNLPMATLQRRRRRIESRFITIGYDVNLKAVGLMRVRLLITLGGSSTIAKTVGYLINMPFVSKVSKVFGGTKHVLLAEAITSTMDIGGIASIIDAVRRVEDVTDVSWFTDVEEVAKNPDAILRHFEVEAIE
jgi:DNA-binding Lrp family transcriptional regulator